MNSVKDVRARTPGGHAELRASIYQNETSFPTRLISETKPVTPYFFFFFSFLKQVNHLSTLEVLKKIYRVENFRANVLKLLEGNVLQEWRVCVFWFFER